MSKRIPIPETDPDYVVEVGHTAVWVNGKDGCCVARFGRMGAEIHRNADDQMTKGECIICEHGPTDLEAWDRWVGRVKTYFGVIVKDDAKPSFLFQQRKPT